MGVLCVQSLVYAERPNIVLIVADDLGWGDVGFHGSKIETPHLDQLAKSGARLSQFYVQPTCSPTRTALMTGRYPFRVGAQVRVLRPYHKHGVCLSEHFLSEVLQEAGYRTAITGKWHLGLARRAYWPQSRGFDLQYGCLGGAVDYFTREGYGSLDWSDTDTIPLREQGYTTELIGQRAGEVISKHQFSDQPLFLYVPFTAPHSPIQATAEDIKRYASVQNKKRRVYCAMVTAMDREIGRILAALKERSVSENTLVMFFSDNGGHTDGAISKPLRGHKGRLYEGGIRVPTVVSWPGKISAGSQVEEPMHVVDLLPTFAGLAKASMKKCLPLDGRDVWPLIAGSAGAPGERVIVHNLMDRRGRGGIRVGDWKLVVSNSSKAPQGVPLAGGALAAELFDLSIDPYESKNLAKEKSEKVKTLHALLKSFSKGLGDSKPYGMPKPDGWVAPADWSGAPE